MDIKEKYYSLIKEKSLPNILGEILEVSYSKKISILEELCYKYHSFQICLNHKSQIL